jgi:hypothetical protein
VDDLPPTEPQVTRPAAAPVKAHPLDSVDFDSRQQSAIDLDAVPAPSLSPLSGDPAAEFEIDIIIEDSNYSEDGQSPEGSEGGIDKGIGIGIENETDSGIASSKGAFSDSLITSDDY